MKIFIDIVLIIAAVCLQVYFVGSATDPKAPGDRLISWIFIILLTIFIALMGGVIGVHVWQFQT